MNRRVRFRGAGIGPFCTYPTRSGATYSRTTRRLPHDALDEECEVCNRRKTEWRMIE